MLLLFETAAGYAVFKVLDEKKLAKTENLYKDFQTPEGAAKVLKLMHFEQFKDMAEALAATTAGVEGKVSKKLKKMLKKLFAKEAHEQLAVADAKLGNAIKDKLNISCVANSSVLELMREIRAQADSLLSGFPQKEMAAMALGLAHSLSRYKLKFSPDKIDTMIIQAISLLDDLDKELNNYVMRCREWYGWHFPELGKIITDNLVFVKTVKILGIRENTATTDLSEILPEDVEMQVKEAAEISMGTEIAEDDIKKILNVCDEIINMTDYRAQLYEYLKNRMVAIAPNLTVIVGELVGARLIGHAGSLLNLAKHPASTVQILGAEKALFRALKTKHDTPKYGLIYHSQLVSQSGLKIKGKVSRMVATKAALSVRLDALGEDVDQEFGIKAKAELLSRIRMLEEGGTRQISGKARAQAKKVKYESKSEFKQYPDAADITEVGKGKKRKFKDEFSETPKKFKQEYDDGGECSGFQGTSPPKKKKKIKHEPEPEEVAEENVETPSTEKKKKKKKKIKQESE